MIIGVTGLIGSGKGAVADILVGKGFFKLGHSGVIDEELIARGFTPGVRENQVQVANEMREKFGRAVLAKKLIEKIEPGKNYVVEGFRNVAEVEEFRKIRDFVLIGVAAGVKRRYKWVSNRERQGDPQSFQDFLEIEKRDFLQKEEFGQQNALCFAMADRFVQNEGSLDDLKIQVEKALSDIENNKT